jgi:hypothetical protein
LKGGRADAPLLSIRVSIKDKEIGNRNLIVTAVEVTQFLEKAPPSEFDSKMLNNQLVLAAFAGIINVAAGQARSFNATSVLNASAARLRGIDVSSYQGAIDWHRVATVPDMTFACAKAGDKAGPARVSPDFACLCTPWRLARTPPTRYVQDLTDSSWRWEGESAKLNACNFCWKQCAPHVHLQATEGLTYTDAQFHANWNGMKAAGIVRCAYHFAHPNEDATAQAAFFVKTVNGAGGCVGTRLATFSLDSAGMVATR